MTINTGYKEEAREGMSFHRGIFSIIYWGIRLTLPRFWTQVMLLFMWLGAVVYLFLSLVDYLIRALDFVNIRDFMHWQQRGVVFFVAIIGSGLIAADWEGKAFVLYFSRPLRRVQYFLGKLGILTFYFFFMIFSPTATMILMEYLSKEKTALKTLGQVGLALFCCFNYTVVMVLSLGVITLGISALANTRRGACFLWISFYFMSETLYQFLTLGLSHYSEMGKWLQLISLRRNIELLGSWIFSPFVEFASPPALAWYWPTLILLALSTLSWLCIVYRIQSKIS